MTVVRFRYPAAIPACILFLVLAVPAWAATIRVPDDHAKIADAVAAAASGDTIEIAAGTYTETATITASDKSLTFQGAGRDDTIIQRTAQRADASTTNTLFDLGSTGLPADDFVIRDLTIRHSKYGIYISSGGDNESNLTLERVAIRDNVGGRRCGLDFYGHSLTMTDCLVVDNEASEASTSIQGGAVYIGADTYTLTRCVIRGNTAEGDSSAYGAGVYVYEEATNPGPQKIVDCEISGNSATAGGPVEGVGIFIKDTGSGIDTMLVNTTISGNTVTSSGDTSQGGGLAVADGDHTVSLDSCTISGNSAQKGGGIAMPYVAGNKTLQVTNTIIHGNTADYTGPDMYDNNGANADIVSGGANIVGDSGGFVWHTSSPTDQIGVDPGLAALADNGGPTKTHAISADSPACDAGSTEQTEDQRGAARPYGEADDIGAYEYNPDFDNPAEPGTPAAGGGGGGGGGCTPGAGSTLWLALLAPGALWLAARRG